MSKETMLPAGTPVTLRFTGERGIVERGVRLHDRDGKPYVTYYIRMEADYFPSVLVLPADLLRTDLVQVGGGTELLTAQEMGRRGGASTSEAKRAAAVVNARKGGWPKGRPRKPRE